MIGLFFVLIILNGVFLLMDIGSLMGLCVFVLMFGLLIGFFVCLSCIEFFGWLWFCVILCIFYFMGLLGVLFLICYVIVNEVRIMLYWYEWICVLGFLCI